MNWIELFKQLCVEARNVSTTREDNSSRYYFFSILCAGSDHKHAQSFPALELAIKQGNINNVKYYVANLTPQLVVLKKMISFMHKYEKYSGKKTIIEASSYNQPYSETENTGDTTQWRNLATPIRFTSNGELAFNIPSFMIEMKALENPAKFFLYCSRLLRDAEKRCMKHPKFQQI